MSKVLLVKDHQIYKKGDILVFDGKEFVKVGLDYILNDLNKKVGELTEKTIEQEKTINELVAINKFDHGIISEEEFNKICGSNK